MHQLTLRERLGMGVAAAVVLTLGVGSCAYSRAGFGAVSSDHTLLAPTAGNGQTVEVPAGGGDSDPVPAAASGVAGAVAPSVPRPAAVPLSVVVHVVGAVKKPGVYHLKIGDRLDDAIHAAGGFASGAQQDVLNLADTVHDADQVYVPRSDETSGASGGTAALMQSAQGKRTGTPPSRTRRRTYIVRGSSPVNPGFTPIPPLTMAPPPTRAAGTPLPGIVYANGGGSPAPVAAITVAPGRVLGRPSSTVVLGSGEEGDPAAIADEEAAGTEATAAVTNYAPSAAAGGKRGARGVAKSGSVSASKKFKNPGDGVVHLNSAGITQFMMLPGVGKATAEKALEYRAQIGRFTAITQIMDVKGIGPKKFEKMRPFLAL